MRNRLKYLDVGGKRFWFNVNELKRDGISTYYMKVNSKHHDKEESLTLFPSQFPSVVYKMLEAFSEVCEKEGMSFPNLDGVHPTTPVNTDEIPEMSEPGVEEFHCPECGTGIYDPNVEFSGYLWIHRIGTDNDLIAVHCNQCKWHPEVEKASSTNGAVFSASSEEGIHWNKYATW